MGSFTAISACSGGLAVTDIAVTDVAADLPVDRFRLAGRADQSEQKRTDEISSL